MTEKMTVELPIDLAQQLRTVASRTHRSVDEVLVDCLRRAGAEPILESLPDEDLLAVCDSEMDPGQEEELSELLERNQEGTLTTAERDRLDDLMRTYRVALARKAQAIKVAVARGLRPRLS